MDISMNDTEKIIWFLENMKATNNANAGDRAYEYALALRRDRLPIGQLLAAQSMYEASVLVTEAYRQVYGGGDRT
jgi:hypothetical protein